MNYFTDNWDRSHTNYNLTKRDFGMWDIFIPRNEDGSLPIPHDSKIKVLPLFGSNMINIIYLRIYSFSIVIIIIIIILYFNQ